jgi:hypothetical protein
MPRKKYRKMKRNKSHGVKIYNIAKKEVNQMKNSAFFFPVLTVTETVFPVRNGCKLSHARDGLLFSAQNGNFVVSPYFFQIKILGRYLASNNKQAINSVIGNFSITGELHVLVAAP